MRKINTGLILLLLLITISCKQQKQEKQSDATKGNTVAVIKNEIDTPFGKVTITEPDFDNAEKFLIIDFGAVPGDKEKISEAIGKAIDEANKNGGGKVVIPAGEWLTKKIHLKSNVNLHLEKDAVLLFSGDPQDYLPPVKTTWEGMECYNYSPLIYAYECKNVAITGEGKLQAKMDIWREWFDRPSGHMENLKRLYNLAAKGIPVEERQMVNDSANFRPQFIQFNRCENILVEGVSIRHSPFWVLHPFMSKNIVIRNVDVFATVTTTMG